MRSGWNRSSSESFSPVEAYMIGLPVTAFTDSAAPPRASPSSFVIRTPSNSAFSAELLGDVHGVLAGHRVEHQQDVVRLRALADRDELVHQLGVDVQATRRVDDEDVLLLGARHPERPLGDVNGVAVGRLRVDGGAGALADGGELLDGRGALQVAGGERDGLLLPLELHRELRARRRLAGALEAGHEDHRGPLRGEGQVAARSRP